MEQQIKNEVHALGDLFRQLYDKYSRMENKKYLYKDMKELTIIEINTILVIGRDDSIKSMSQIANALGVSFGTPTVTIDRLIHKGYVERLRDGEDRRQVFIKLSEKGKEVYQSVVKLKNKVAERIYGVLDEEERTFLLKILAKMNDSFDQLFNGFR